MSDKEKILTIIDKKTGKVQASINLEDKTFGKDGWLAMFQKAMDWIGNQHMTGEQLSVLFKLLSRVEFDNRIVFKSKDIAEETGIQPSHISRALRVLKDKDIIYKDPNNERVYKLNPHIGHKGTKKYKSNIIEFTGVKVTKHLEENIEKIDPETGEVFD